MNIYTKSLKFIKYDTNGAVVFGPSGLRKLVGIVYMSSW